MSYSLYPLGQALTKMIRCADLLLTFCAKTPTTTTKTTTTTTNPGLNEIGESYVKLKKEWPRCTVNRQQQRVSVILKDNSISVFAAWLGERQGEEG